MVDTSDGSKEQLDDFEIVGTPIASKSDMGKHFSLAESKIDMEKQWQPNRIQKCKDSSALHYTEW